VSHVWLQALSGGVYPVSAALCDWPIMKVTAARMMLVPIFDQEISMPVHHAGDPWQHIRR
jgi:hypothetical protein